MTQRGQALSNWECFGQLQRAYCKVASKKSELEWEEHIAKMLRKQEFKMMRSEEEHGPKEERI